MPSDQKKIVGEQLVYILKDMPRNLVEVPSSRGIGIYKLISFLQHSCTPNAILQSISNTGELSVIAMKDIDIGESITVSFVPYDLPYHQRQLALKGIASNFR